MVVLTGGTLAVAGLVVPVLTAPSGASELASSTLTQVSDTVAGVCAVALGLAWAWLLLATVVCLRDELAAPHAPLLARPRPWTLTLRPAVAQGLARALLGGGLSALLVPAPAHAAAPVELPLPVRVTDGPPAATAPARSAAGVRTPPRSPSTAGTVVVRPGDSLWSLAAGDLPSTAPGSAVDAAWRRLYARNRAAIGPDPDLIHPGVRLRLP